MLLLSSQALLTATVQGLCATLRLARGGVAPVAGGGGVAPVAGGVGVAVWVVEATLKTLLLSLCGRGSEAVRGVRSGVVEAAAEAVYLCESRAAIVKAMDAGSSVSQRSLIRGAHTDLFPSCFQASRFFPCALRCCWVVAGLEPLSSIFPLLSWAMDAAGR